MVAKLLDEVRPHVMSVTPGEPKLKIEGTKTGRWDASVPQESNVPKYGDTIELVGAEQFHDDVEPSSKTLAVMDPLS